MKPAESRVCERCGVDKAWQEFTLQTVYAADMSFYGWCRQCVFAFYAERPVTDADALAA
jgi:hypothetical protein